LDFNCEWGISIKREAGFCRSAGLTPPIEQRARDIRGDRRFARFELRREKDAMPDGLPLRDTPDSYRPTRNSVPR
jgi:hypothetical protein